MPVVKETNIAGKAALYHVVTSVEVFKLGDATYWRGNVKSYAQISGGAPPVAITSVSGVPFTDLGSDPLDSFERTSVTAPDCPLYGGEVVAAESGHSGLDVERKLAWARVKQGRDAYLDGGVETPVGRFDSNLNTLVNVLGAATTMLDGGSRGWILADHTPVVLTKGQVLELGAALVALRDGAYERGSYLYAQIQAAQGLEEIRAIGWTPPA